MNELEHYEMEAEDRFHDYDGEDQYAYEADYDDDFDTGLGGADFEDDDEGEVIEEIEYIPEMYDEDDYDGYDAETVGEIDPNDRTLTVVVKNTSDQPATAIVFGANQQPVQPDGVTVEVEESSHREVQEESKSSPFKISGFKMSTTENLQFDQVLKVTKRTATGTSNESVYQPRSATSPQNLSQLLIDDESFEMNVTGQSSLRFTILPNTTVVFTFTIKARANMGNLLKGRNVAEMSQVPRTTGLPQLDLMRKKKRKKKPATRVVRRVVREPSRRKRRLGGGGQGRPSRGNRRYRLKRR